MLEIQGNVIDDFLKFFKSVCGHTVREKFSIQNYFFDLRASVFRRFAKRQLTWFRADASIVWVENPLKNLNQIEKLIKKFLG
jgi:tRNA A37 N6-isopentenylltransferase MiaA